MALGYGNNYGRQNFVCLLNQYIGETVTIFTTSGGASGCGFTGVLLAVNCDFVRLSTLQGTPPANPLNQEICGAFNGGMPLEDNNGQGCYDYGHNKYNTVGSVCDIPTQLIACFTHNAV